MGEATKTRAEHTPGPWRLRRVAGGVWATGISRGPHVGLGRDVAVCRGEGARANARLIAAAPELLAAAEAVLHDAGAEKITGDLNASLDDLRAAIIKARGES